MATLADHVFDNGLNVLDIQANKIFICSDEPTTLAQADTTYALGNSTSLSIGAPADRSGGGRQVTIAAITDGSVTASGTATHYAIVDTSATYGGPRLLATGSLTASQSVTSGNTFTLTSTTIGIPDPA